MISNQLLEDRSNDNSANKDFDDKYSLITFLWLEQQCKWKKRRENDTFMQKSQSLCPVN